MNAYYKDILDKLGEPIWWDENAVPRYCGFSPENIANIYAAECVLIRIICQGCGTPFNVAMSMEIPIERKFSELLDEKYPLSYGCPPNVFCCDNGIFISSESIEILEFWQKTPDSNYEWERIPRYEISFSKSE